MGVSAIICRISTRQRFRQTSEQNTAPLRLPFSGTLQPKQVPDLRSNPSRQFFEHHSPGSPCRVKRIGPRIFAHLLQTSVTKTLCLANSARLCDSVKSMKHLRGEEGSGNNLGTIAAENRAKP